MNLVAIKKGAAAVHHEVKVCLLYRTELRHTKYMSLHVDAVLPPDNRLSIASLSGLPNGGPTMGSKDKSFTWGGANWSGLPNATAFGKAPPGRDPKSRARSREILKQ